MIVSSKACCKLPGTNSPLPSHPSSFYNSYLFLFLSRDILSHTSWNFDVLYLTAYPFSHPIYRYHPIHLGRPFVWCLQDVRWNGGRCYCSETEQTTRKSERVHTCHVATATKIGSLRPWIPEDKLKSVSVSDLGVGPTVKPVVCTCLLPGVGQSYLPVV